MSCGEESIYFGNKDSQGSEVRTREMRKDGCIGNRIRTSDAKSQREVPEEVTLELTERRLPAEGYQF